MSGSYSGYVSTEQYAETLLVTMLNFFICFFALLMNTLVIITIQKSPHFVNSYGTLSLNHSVLNMLSLLVYFLWVTPTTYTQSVSTSTTTVLGKIIGQLHLLFLFSMIYSHLSLSLNRFASLLHPTRTRSIFSHHMCIFLNISTWILGFLHVIPLFWYQDCHITYDPATWQWVISTSKLCATYKLLVLQYLSVIVSTISFLVNLFTWAKVSAETIRKHPVETKLLKGEFWRSFGFLIAVLTSGVLSGWVQERWQKYVVICVIWQVYHLVDGLVILLLHFHRKLLAERHILDPNHHTPSFIHVEHLHSLPHRSPDFNRNHHVSKVDTY
ncbi:CRE-SRX-14 protein [Caenorhabditis remanei]|uniref:CRE-SRX-14 protein n=1 Tax=Caenorhabditis remanei TaxID=31234 RepID=E3NEU6_CAERE|nr:CRE-SRX-14 protein [Caenorhabditis remanei]